MNPSERPNATAPADSPDPNWQRSSFCSSTTCVEVSSDGQVVRVRDSKRSDSPVLTFDGDEWREFIAGVKRNEFNL